MLKVADFGLGKDLQVFTSHQTLHTNAMGQYYYCAPEQFMMLKDADKRSDVYSLGRVINFIMTGDARNSHHIYRSVAEKQLILMLLIDMAMQPNFRHSLKKQFNIMLREKPRNKQKEKFKTEYMIQMLKVIFMI